MHKISILFYQLIVKSKEKKKRPKPNFSSADPALFVRVRKGIRWVWRGIMPANDLHRACGCYEGGRPLQPDWGRAGALLGLGEGADPHPDAKRLCAEKHSGGAPDPSRSEP